MFILIFEVIKHAINKIAWERKLMTLLVQGVESLVYKVKATPHAMKHGTFSSNIACTLFSTKFALSGELAKRKLIFSFLFAFLFNHIAILKKNFGFGVSVHHIYWLFY
jgi:hypothetical protein